MYEEEIKKLRLMDDLKKRELLYLKQVAKNN